MFLTKALFNFIKSEDSSSDFKCFNNISKVTSSKASPTSILSKIQNFQKAPIILSRHMDQELILTTSHSTVPDGSPSFSSSSSKNHDEFNCVVIQDMNEPVLPVKIDILDLFNHSNNKKTNVPPIESIINIKDEKSLNKLKNSIPTTSSSASTPRTIKPFVIIPHCLALDIIKSDSREPFKMLTSILNNIKINTNYFQEEKKNDFPDSLMDIIYFLFFSYCNKNKKNSIPNNCSVLEYNLFKDSCNAKWLNSNFNFLTDFSSSTTSTPSKETTVDNSTPDRDENITTKDKSSPTESESSNNTPSTAHFKTTQKLVKQLTKASKDSKIDPNLAMLMNTVAVLASSNCSSQIESSKITKGLMENYKNNDNTTSSSGSWRKINKSLKATILTAMSDGLSIPDSPTEGLQKIIQAKNGAVIKMRLHQQFKNNIMDLDVGMCTALSCGLILSLPDTWSINNFSPFSLLKAKTHFPPKV